MPLRLSKGRIICTLKEEKMPKQGRILVITFLALIASLVLFGSNAALASNGASVEVTLEVTNTADPSLLGAPIYEISMVTFMRGDASVTAHSIFPSVSLSPGQTETFGPFSLAVVPDRLAIFGRRGPPGPARMPFAITIRPLVFGVPHEEDSLRVIAVRGISPEGEPSEGDLSGTWKGFLFKTLQLWCSRSEGPLYLLQTQDVTLGLEGFYILVYREHLPWQEDPFLETLLHRNVSVRGRMVAAGAEVRIHEGFPTRYPLPAIRVEEITVTTTVDRCSDFLDLGR